MSCGAATLLMDSYEEPALGMTTSKPAPDVYLRRRRHSSYHPLTWTVEPDNIQLIVDHFLSQLGRRLDFLESYGQVKLDSSIERAWSTLHAVRDACSRVSDEMIDAGRRKARILVETLEERYKEALVRKETLEQRVLEGVRFMETLLADYETQAYDVRNSGITLTAYDLLDEGKRKMDEGIERAREVMDESLDMARRAAESLELAIQNALAKSRKEGLIKIHDLPDPWHVNEYIISGYRFSDSLTECIRSSFGLSNELFNIWSHALGLVIVLSIAFYFYPSSVYFTLSNKTDVLVAGVFFLAACKCLVCSIIWHTFNSLAERQLVECLACVDYTGISVLIAASIMTTEYTVFYCEPVYCWFWIGTTATLGIAGTILPWNPTFNRSDLSWLRVVFYVSLSATGFLPGVQVMWTRGLEWTLFFYAPICKSVLVYLVGAVLYACKIPERWWPGMFDYIGGSHNIWHVAVLGGILFHYYAMQEFFAKAFMRASDQCSPY